MTWDEKIKMVNERDAALLAAYVRDLDAIRVAREKLREKKWEIHKTIPPTDSSRKVLLKEAEKRFKEEEQAAEDAYQEEVNQIWKKFFPTTLLAEGQEPERDDFPGNLNIC